MKKYHYLIAILISVLLALVTCQLSTELSCSVSHRGNLIFDILLPHVSTKSELYFKKEEAPNWKQEEDCYLSKKHNRYKCKMKEFTNENRGVNDKTSSYEFKLSSVLENGKLKDITRFYFENTLTELQPWIAMNGVSHCKGSITVKFLSVTAGFNNIMVEWYMHPFYVDNYKLFKSKITIKDADSHKKDEVPIPEKDKKGSICEEDFCRYAGFSNLEPCKYYNVCIETEDNFMNPHQNECKRIKTYCGIKHSKSKWKQILLIIFAVVVALILALVVYKINARCIHPTSDDTVRPRQQPIDQEDLYQTCRDDQHL